jgi:hypothetical protein
LHFLFKSISLRQCQRKRPSNKLKTRKRGGGGLFSKLAPSIRHQMRKAGISIVKNTYIGFDTEFNNKDLKINTLVSAQIAIASKFFVKFPKSPRYSISVKDI